MEPEDFTPRKTDTLKALETEDLSSLSIEELEERAERLRAEITRADAAAAAKRASKNVADAVFKS